MWRVEEGMEDGGGVRVSKGLRGGCNLAVFSRRRMFKAISGLNNSLPLGLWAEAEMQGTATTELPSADVVHKLWIGNEFDSSSKTVTPLHKTQFPRHFDFDFFKSIPIFSIGTQLPTHTQLNCPPTCRHHGGHQERFRNVQEGGESKANFSMLCREKLTIHLVRSCHLCYSGIPYTRGDTGYYACNGSRWRWYATQCNCLSTELQSH
jgi:hypothetical protein